MSTANRPAGGVARSISRATSMGVRRIGAEVFGAGIRASLARADPLLARVAALAGRCGPVMEMVP